MSHGAAQRGLRIGVVYEAQAGSFLRDECEDCDRIPIEEPIRGRLTLIQVPAGFPGELYEVSDVEIASVSGAYVLAGKGSSGVLRVDPPTQTMALDRNRGEEALPGSPSHLHPSPSSGSEGLRDGRV